MNNITSNDLSSLLQNVKTLLGITTDDKNDLLNLMINQSINEACNYCHRTDIDSLYGTIIDMTIFKYNHLGCEGLNSESYSGVSFNYQVDYSDSIYAQLRSKRKAVFI